MLNSLLEWARLQKDQVTVEIEQLNWREIANSSIELNTGISQARNISVENKVAKDQTVTTDKNTLLTVINNLLTKAIKFSATGQKVILSSISENNHINFIV